MSSITAKRIRLALIGAGIFMRDAHLPALLRLRDQFEIAAIFSRTPESAATLVERIGGPVEVVSDLPSLLARDDIDAVDVVLPIPAQAAILALALVAGKHVVSEKPIAPDQSTARELIELHQRHPNQVWMVAENWRYEEAFMRVAELMHEGVIGRPIAVHFAQYTAMTPKNKYYRTQWRRSGSFPGGFLVDGGVHHAAVLRMLVGDIAAVQAMVTQAAPDLPPLDTVSATIRFANGALGTYLNTFAAGTPFAAALTIVGDRGSLRVERGRIEIADAQGEVRVTECEYYNGVLNELAAFGDAIQTGATHNNTPEQALEDLHFMEAILASAQTTT